MTIKIINNSDLNYKDIGNLIDKMRSETTTNYVGKWREYIFTINDKHYVVETLIMKTCFKVHVRNIML